MSILLYVVAGLTLVGGFFIGFLDGDIGMVFYGIIATIFLCGFAEVVRLLEGIRGDMKKLVKRG